MNVRERSDLRELTIGRITVEQPGGLLQRDVLGHKLTVDPVQVLLAFRTLELHGILELLNVGKLLSGDLVCDDPVRGRATRAKRRATRSGETATLHQNSATGEL